MREMMRLMDEMIRLLLTMTAVLLTVANRASGWVLGGLLQGMGVEKGALSAGRGRAFGSESETRGNHRRSWGEPPVGFDHMGSAEGSGPGRSADFAAGGSAGSVVDAVRPGDEAGRTADGPPMVIRAAAREEDAQEKVSVAGRKATKEANRMKIVLALVWILLALSLVSAGVGVRAADEYGPVMGTVMGLGAGCFVAALAASLAFAGARLIYRRPERPRPVRGGASKRIRRASSGENRPVEPIGRERVVTLRPRGDGDGKDGGEAAGL